MSEEKSAMSNDSPIKIILVAVVLCLVCSVLVSAAAIGLRPQQAANKLAEKQRNILQVAGIETGGASITSIFDKSIEARVVDLRTGKFTTDVDAKTYDSRKAARDEELSKALTKDEDPASIKRKVHYATVYLVKGDGGGYKSVIVPVHGYGLWSTLYGFLALKPDGNEVIGLQFYEHAETPGLGGEVDNPRWRSQWAGKKLYSGDDLKIEIVKSGASGAHQVDGLAGATLTSRGVHNLVRYWAGEDGFGPFLKNLKQELSK